MRPAGETGRLPILPFITLSPFAERRAFVPQPLSGYR